MSFQFKRESSVRKFHVSLLARGARMEFSNGEYTYEIYEPLQGSSSIVVSRDGKETATIECRNNTDSLTETANLNWFRSPGHLRVASFSIILPGRNSSAMEGQARDSAARSRLGLENAGQGRDHP